MKTFSLKSATTLVALTCLAVPATSLARNFSITSGQLELNTNVANQGWWNSSGTATTTNGNYLVGFNGGVEYRNFFSFYLGEIPDGWTINTAKLHIFSPLNGNTAPGTLNFWDVTTSWEILNTNIGVAPASLWTDLGGGVNYASVVYAGIPSMNVMHTYTLNAAAATDLTAAIGKFWSVATTYTSTGNMYGFTSGTFRATLEVDATGPSGTTCDTSSLEEQLCVITDLVLTPQGQRCADTAMCGAGSHPHGLASVPDAGSCAD